MTDTKTPTEASADWLCPLARVFADQKAEPMCRGPKCAAWRWMPITTGHPAFKTALATAAAETGETRPPFPKAARLVADDPAKYGMPAAPTHGYCGVGGA